MPMKPSKRFGRNRGDEMRRPDIEAIERVQYLLFSVYINIAPLITTLLGDGVPHE